MWDPAKCMCRCPLSSLQECSSKFVFDFTNSCKCIPEENNDVGFRAQPSQEEIDKANPEDEDEKSDHLKLLAKNWYLLVAFAGLVFGLLFFIIVTATLVSNVRKLKTRLRRSAEVSAPNTATASLTSASTTPIDLAASPATVSPGASGSLLRSNGHIYRPVPLSHNGSLS